MITQLREKSQVTIPKEIIKKLNLKIGDSIDIDVEDNKIVIKPVVVVPKDQAWFWSREWQHNEKQADKDITKGRTKKLNSAQELFEDLDN